MEKRKSSKGPAPKSAPLPEDYLQMVSQVFESNFSDALKTLSEKFGEASVVSRGGIYPDEIVLSISIVHKGRLAATTVHSSSDFDPKASAPKAEDVLSICVDALANFIGQFLMSKNEALIIQFAGESLSELEKVPFQWTSFKNKEKKRDVFLKMDKSNPVLDHMTNQWLEKNDPLEKERKKNEQEAAEDLFVTGKGSNGGESR